MVFQSFFGSNKKFCDWSDKFLQFSIRVARRYFFYTFNFPIFFKFALSLNQKVSVIEKLKSNKQSKKLIALLVFGSLLYQLLHNTNLPSCPIFFKPNFRCRLAFERARLKHFSFLRHFWSNSANEQQDEHPVSLFK